MPLRYDKPRKIIKESEQFPSREKMNQEDLNNQVLQCTGLCGIEGWNSLCHLRGNHQWKEHGDSMWGEFPALIVMCTRCQLKRGCCKSRSLQAQAVHQGAGTGWFRKEVGLGFLMSHRVILILQVYWFSIGSAQDYVLQGFLSSAWLWPLLLLT